ncbi:hypothetical protein C2U69_30900 [Cupriavidus pinatubonensis]|nr:hypothetical protein C2U69_30900 [Cupriavidus pinatubonensis]
MSGAVHGHHGVLGSQARQERCRTKCGIACAYCNLSSIRLWRYDGLLSNRDQHLCNHCGSNLYDS